MSHVFVRDAVSCAEGEGAEVNRLFPLHGYMNFDPFVLWDDFTVPPTAGFPDHPHRGFEGITYVFEGSMLHKDNLGNAATVEAGGLQRFTAGSGIVHSEMPSPSATTRGIQMWVNLPLSLKKVAPEYQQINSDAVMEQIIGTARIRHLAGEDTELKVKTPVLYLDVTLSDGEFEQIIPDRFRGFIYMVTGSAESNGEKIEVNQAQFHEGSRKITVVTQKECRFMVCFGQPHGEPIYQHGPYVD